MCVCVVGGGHQCDTPSILSGKVDDASETLSNFNQYLTTAATARGRAPTVLGRTMAQKKRFGEGAKEPREPSIFKVKQKLWTWSVSPYVKPKKLGLCINLRCWCITSSSASKKINLEVYEVPILFTGSRSSPFTPPTHFEDSRTGIHLQNDKSMDGGEA